MAICMTRYNLALMLWITSLVLLPPAYNIQYMCNIIVNSRTDLPNNIKNISFASFVIKAQRIYYSFFSILFHLKVFYFWWLYNIHDTIHISLYAVVMQTEYLFFGRCLYRESIHCIVSMEPWSGSTLFFPKYKIQNCKNSTIFPNQIYWKWTNNKWGKVKNKKQLDILAHLWVWHFCQSFFFSSFNCEQCIRFRRRRRHNE